MNVPASSIVKMDPAARHHTQASSPLQQSHLLLSAIYTCFSPTPNGAHTHNNGDFWSYSIRYIARTPTLWLGRLKRKQPRHVNLPVFANSARFQRVPTSAIPYPQLPFLVRWHYQRYKTSVSGPDLVARGAARVPPGTQESSSWHAFKHVAHHVSGLVLKKRKNPNLLS